MRKPNKENRENRVWEVDYVYARPGTTMPICGMPLSGYMKIEAMGNEQKARARALSALCKKHLVSPTEITIISMKAGELCTSEHTSAIDAQ